MLSKTHLKKIAALKKKKIRNQENLFLVEGYRLCYEAIQSAFIVETLLIHPTRISPQNLNKIRHLADTRKIEVLEINESEVKQLAETVHSQGIFCIVQQKHFSVDFVIKKKNKAIVIIDSGQDPGNLGTIIRTCDWFGIDAVFLSGGTVELYNEKVVRASMGSIFHLPIIENINLATLLHRLRQLGYPIFAADVHGEYLYHQINYQPPLALILGNENKGIDERLDQYLDKTIKIPAYGKAESLNIALAGAIIISRIVN